MIEGKTLFSGALRAAVTTVCLALCLLALAGAALAEVGNIVVVNGQVSILRGGQLPAVPATVGTGVNGGDFVRTKSSSGCEIRFSDGNVIKVGPRSRIDISEYAIDRDTRTIGLNRGKVEAVVVPPLQKDTKEQPKRFEIHTPNAVAGVRGTDLLVFYEGNATGILVISLHGGDTVYAYSLLTPGQLLDLPAGFITYVRGDQLPTPARPASEAEINALLREPLVRMSSGAALELLALGGVPQESRLTDVPISDNFPALLATAYEVGRVEMSGSGTNFSIDNMTIQFLSPTAGGSPSTWLSTDVQGSWSAATILPGDSASLFGEVPDGWAGTDFIITDWNTSTGRWAADISNGYGGTPNGEQFNFSGKGSGSGASNNSLGSFTGSAGGTVTPNQVIGY